MISYQTVTPSVMKHMHWPDNRLWIRINHYKTNKKSYPW